jgi:hypothetical protein
MKVLSEIFKSALPTKGLRINDEMLETPIKTPILASADPNLER